MNFDPVASSSLPPLHLEWKKQPWPLPTDIKHSEVTELQDCIASSYAIGNQQQSQFVFKTYVKTVNFCKRARSFFHPTVPTPFVDATAFVREDRNRPYEPPPQFRRISNSSGWNHLCKQEHRYIAEVPFRKPATLMSALLASIILHGIKGERI